MNPRRPTPRHIIIKIGKFKDKERILKAAREKQLVTYNRALIRLSADFSTELLQARRDCQGIIQVIKSKDLQPRLLYPARLSCKVERKIKSFPEQKRKKATRVQLHLTSYTGDAKRTTLRKNRE